MPSSRVSPLRRLLLTLVPTLASLLFAGTLHAQFAPPLPEELALTAVPAAPNAPAVMLFHEEITDSSQQQFTCYSRIKILTEGGRDNGIIKLDYTRYSFGSQADPISTFEGRTIHRDGTIIPLTEKPYDKLVEKSGDVQRMERIYTLPSIEPGSIIEYRYTTYSGSQTPQWFLQSDLYTLKEHFAWRPTLYSFPTVDDKGKEVQARIHWAWLLPPGVKVEETDHLVSGMRAMVSSSSAILEVHASNVPPLVDEPHMPPVNSLSYRVLFYYTSYGDVAEFWDRIGKVWARDCDAFMKPGSQLKAEVARLTTPEDQPLARLSKLYAAVMALENTDFTRVHSAQEDRNQGVKKVTNVDQLLARKRGSGDELAMLFVSMARASGLQAYLMAVSDRSQRTFWSSFLSLRQLDDLIAIVNVDGKEMFFDPGQRYTAFGHLAWQHTLTTGLRENATGTTIASTPGESFLAEKVQRKADLALSRSGEASGQVQLVYTGDAARSWRQDALRGDETSLKASLRSALQDQLPAGMDISVTTVSGLADYDKPLTVSFDVHGPIASATGKRLLVPFSLFEAQTKPEFPGTVRQLGIDLHHPAYVLDTVHLTLAPGLAVESAPAQAADQMGNAGGFTLDADNKPGTLTLVRSLQIGKSTFTLADYPALRTFFLNLDTHQAEPIILTRTEAAP